MRTVVVHTCTIIVHARTRIVHMSTVIVHARAMIAHMSTNIVHARAIVMHMSTQVVQALSRSPVLVFALTGLQGLGPCPSILTSSWRIMAVPSTETPTLHAIVIQIVRECRERGRPLSPAPLSPFRTFAGFTVFSYAFGMLTRHSVHLGDARNLSFIPSESVHLVVTSPPYGALIHYSDGPDQLGSIQSYELFLDELDKVWAECLRVLVPGGRVACVVGDVCLSRKRAGRHHVLPLSADIQVRSRRIGFDNLTPIRWMKVSNIKLEASTSSVFLGKPNLPNGVVKNDVESILFLRKPGGYRKPTTAQEKASFIPTEDYRKWFAAAWTDVKGQLRRDHPAPYPVEIPRRLIRMFSFAGDTVVDPFAGTGTTAVAAMEVGRNSISVEIEAKYIKLIQRRLNEAPLGASVDYHTEHPAKRPVARRA